MNINLLLFFLLSVSTHLSASVPEPVSYWDHQIKNQSNSDIWNTFLDPTHINFWKEGDYTPPTPLIMAMRNPTETNIEKFLGYLTLRASYQSNFQQALLNYKRKKIDKVLIAVRTDCRACHELMMSIDQSGFNKQKVQLFQLDNGTKPELFKIWSHRKIPQSSRERLRITLVPTVWIKYRSGSLKRLDDPQQLLEEIY